MNELLDAELTKAFDRAHDAPQWSSPAWPDPAGRIRRRAARTRTRRAVAGVAATAVVAGGVVAAAQLLPTGEDRVVPAEGGRAAATAGGDGTAWLLSPKDYEAYTAAHPSPSPSTDLVASPAPDDAELAQLQADIAAAVPATAQTVRADAADGGARGSATVWLRLADGTPVAVERYRLDYPRVLSADTDPAATEKLAPEQFTAPRTWADGTAYTVVTGMGFGYGFDAQTQWNGPFVWTVTPDGWFTSWTAPVDPQRLVDWAHSADAAFTSG